MVVANLQATKKRGVTRGGVVFIAIPAQLLHTGLGEKWEKPKWDFRNVKAVGSGMFFKTHLLSPIARPASQFIGEGFSVVAIKVYTSYLRISAEASGLLVSTLQQQLQKTTSGHQQTNKSVL